GAVVLLQVTTQADALFQRIPKLLEADPIKALPVPRWLAPYRRQIEQAARDQLNFYTNSLPLVQAAVVKVLSQLAAILSIVLIPILGFFFLADNGRIFQ